MALILLIEEDTDARLELRDHLSADGNDVVETSPLEEIPEAVVRHRPDLVLLDWRQRRDDPEGALRRLRAASDVPVVVLSVEDRKGAKIRALDAGADDFVTKPYDIDELLARVRAVLRRAPRATRAPVIEAEDLEIDLESRTVRRRGERVHLTPTELGLLEELVLHPGRLLTHQYLLQRVWGPSYGTESHYLRVYVAQLRRKLGDSAANPRLITTEPGIGYRWIAEPRSGNGHAHAAAG